MANGLWYASSKAEEVRVLVDTASDGGDPSVEGLLLSMLADAYDEGMRAGYRAGKADRPEPRQAKMVLERK